MTISPRPEVLALSEAVHGSVHAAELAGLGIDPCQVLDFSASVNPFGPSPHAVEAVSQSDWETYPDRDATELRRALACRLDVSIDRLVAGNGSSELLYLIALAYIRPSDAVLVVRPTYSEYARVAMLMGARVNHSAARPESGFVFPADAVADALHMLQPRAVFLCHPNNPTGQIVPVDAVRQWIDTFPQTLFVIDEAYIEYSGDVASFVKTQRDNLIVLRSMTKAYGLAGLRLGYAVCSPDVNRILCTVRPPWSVNAAAQAAGIAALQDVEHLQKCVRLLQGEKARLISVLTSMGLAVCPSRTHYCLVRVTSAADVRRRLLESRILVRDCTSFGLPEFIRISPRTADDNDRLIAAWKRLPGFH